MTYDHISALAAFAFVTSITPGPNNLMLMASSANFGLRRTVPHMLGISIGFTVMVILIGIGLMRLFDAVPVSYIVLKALSAIYLLYLAFRIATATGLGSTKDTGKPLTFLQAAAFQWVNPKALSMALSAIAVYAPTQTLHSVTLVAVVFGLINLPSICVWAVIGREIKRVLTNPKHLRIFNVAMASLLVASLIPIWLN